jgi:hypothetical protein
VKTASLILANLFIVTACILILQNISKRVVTPNSSTFLIRSVVSVMNCFSYLSVVHKDYLKLSVTVMSTASLVIIFFFALKRGQLTKWRRIDVFCGALAFVVGILWKTTGSPVIANFLLQGIILLAMYPAIEGTIKGYIKERAFPWTLPTASYLFMGFAILWEGEFVDCWQELVHPFAGTIGNGALALAAWYQNRKVRKAA